MKFLDSQSRYNSLDTEDIDKLLTANDNLNYEPFQMNALLRNSL